MRNVSLACVVVAGVMSVVGGISRLTLTPILTNSRVWAGGAALLLLLAIALNTLPKNESQ